MRNVDNVCALDYPSILRGRIERGEITWQQAFNWLQGQGMYAGKAKEALAKPVLDGSGKTV
jgi:hypothetical protein